MASKKERSDQTEPLILKFESLDLKDIPTTVFNAENLSELYLDYNDINCLTDVLFSKCSSLQKLSVIGNKLEQLPSNISSLSFLSELYLNENNLESLPEDIHHLTELVVLNITGNNLTALPKEFGALKNLTKLNAEDNKLESLPVTFGLLSSLQVAELSDNCIEELPRSIGHLTRLNVLNLSNNKLSKLSESFSELPSLQELDLSGNNLEYLTDSFSSSASLRKFYADDNVMETLPEWISQTPNMEVLSITDNRLRGKPLVDSMGKICHRLKDLNLSGNFITELPDSIGNLKSLESIQLGSPLAHLERRNFQNGNILWKIPDSFTNLIALRKVSIDENQLCELPSQFGKLVNIEELNLGQNRLMDLPSTFGCLKALRLCILSINNIELLPSSFGELENLEELILDNNMISELPESFKNLKNLHTLDLFNNRLEEIPDCLQELTNIKRLDLSENPLPIHHLRIPNLKESFKVAPRDPSLKNNWRGRTGQCLTDLEITVSEVPGDDHTIPYEPEPKEEELTYNYNALRWACNKNMSLWRSHTDASSKREKALRNDYTKKNEPLNGFVKWRKDCSGENNIFELSNQEEKVEKESGSEEDSWDCDWRDRLTPPLDDVSSHRLPYTTSVVRGNDEEEEDWDKDCDENVPIDNPYSGPYSGRYTYHHELGPDVVFNNDDMFTPSDLHMQNHVHMPLPTLIVDGQFDDAEDDHT